MSNVGLNCIMRGVDHDDHEDCFGYTILPAVFIYVTIYVGVYQKFDNVCSLTNRQGISPTCIIKLLVYDMHATFEAYNIKLLMSFATYPTVCKVRI